MGDRRHRQDEKQKIKQTKNKQKIKPQNSRTTTGSITLGSTYKKKNTLEYEYKEKPWPVVL